MEDDFIPVRISVNGVTHRLFLETRRTLLDVLREDIGLTGTNVGCEHWGTSLLILAIGNPIARA